MFGAVYALAFLGCGYLMIQWLLPGRSPLIRGWLGLSLGVLLLMWLPALAAFPLGFTLAGHGAAFGLLLAATAGIYFLRDRSEKKPWQQEDTRLLRQMVFVLLPLLILSGYMQFTHNLMVKPDGSLWVGQSTYGDLPMHSAFVTNLQGAAFPPDYPFYPGHRLSYPFLADSLSSTFQMMGWRLQDALWIPGTFLMGLVYAGVLIFARDRLGVGKAALLATLLFLFNGGLGFLYHFDQAAGFTQDGTLRVVERVRHILEGFYTTPTNQPEPNNLRWSNVIADLMIPQRTLLAGWAMGIPCFYLLFSVMDGGEGDKRRGTLRPLLLLGVWAGLLPLIHTHTFLALGLCTLGTMVYDLASSSRKGDVLKQYLIFGVLTVVLAAPQLLGFTFSQTFGEGEVGNGFLRFQFNWVNNPDGKGMRDFYLWFYLKNIGLPVLALVGSLSDRRRFARRMWMGALPIVLAAELIRFQPNEYDNNKLLYLAYLLLCLVAADYMGGMWRRLKGLPGRRVLGALTAIALFLSAVLTLWREAVSEYQAFSAEEVAAGEFAARETEKDSLFLAGSRNHLNPVVSLGGRQILCGPDLWLYYHGFNTARRNQDIARFFSAPNLNGDVLTTYGVDYIYVSPSERTHYEVQEDVLNSLYTKVYDSGNIVIWKVQ